MDARNNAERRGVVGVVLGLVDGRFDFVFYPCHRGGN